MTRRVFANSMVAHVWAQQDQDEGRSNNGNFYFVGSTLYSYGSHFVVGRFVTAPSGQRVVLLNSGSYSVSTSGHQSEAASAVRGLGLPVFRVPDPSGTDHLGNVNAMEAEAIELLAKSSRARKSWNRTWYAERAERLLENVAQYAETFGIVWTWSGPEAALEQREERRKAAAEAERKAAAKQRREDAKAFREWQRGERFLCPRSYRRDARGSVYCRVREDNLETSEGATVPLSHAVRVFRFVRQCRERGEGFKSNGRVIRVGHFQVNEITPKGDMIAGCHRFSWERMAEVAAHVEGTDTASAEAVEVRAH